MVTIGGLYAVCYNRLTFQRCNSSMNTEQKWQTIKEKITTGCDLYVSKKAVNPVNPRPMWMNKGTLRSIRKKHIAWAKIVGSRLLKTIYYTKRPEIKPDGKQEKQWRITKKKSPQIWKITQRFSGNMSTLNWKPGNRFLTWLNQMEN